MKMYMSALLLIILFPFASGIREHMQKPANSKTVCRQQPVKIKLGVENLVFKSTNGGQTWQDISEGLPAVVEEGGFFANETGLYFRAGEQTFHSNPNVTAPLWNKAIFPRNWGSIVPGKSGLIAYNYQGEILHKNNGTNVWSPMYTDFQGPVRTVFETAGGTVFIGSDNGLYRSANSGKTWKHVYAGGWVIKIVASENVLLATSMKGIIRSADDGATWTTVISEGGVGIDVAAIRGGFAAISFNTASNTRRVRTSYDAGKTWQLIDAGLQKQSFIAPLHQALSVHTNTDSTWNPNPNNSELPEEAFLTSIIQAGGYFFCSHPKGVFRTSDNGKTWTLILPSVKNKVYQLAVAGNVIYAIPRNSGC